MATNFPTSLNSLTIEKLSAWIDAQVGTEKLKEVPA